MPDLQTNEWYNMVIVYLSKSVISELACLDATSLNILAPLDTKCSLSGKRRRHASNRQGSVSIEQQGTIAILTDTGHLI